MVEELKSGTIPQMYRLGDASPIRRGYLGPFPDLRLPLPVTDILWAVHEESVPKVSKYVNRLFTAKQFRAQWCSRVLIER